jgi:hypothetical protein
VPRIFPTSLSKAIAMKASFWLLFLMNLAASISSSVAQVNVSASFATRGQGQYRYDYTIRNVGSTPINAFDIDIGDAPSAMAAPAGWHGQVLTLDDRRVVQWVAMSSSSDLQPSSSLAGFSITSTRSPGMVTFDAIDEAPYVYDGEETTGPAYLASQLTNISTRLRVGTGDNVLIGGFIITGTQNKKVLIRGIGPSLHAYGLSDLLTDPVIELHDSAGNVIGFNDNWHDSVAELDILDSMLPPTDDKEAAILTELTPGAYTAILRGANGASGVGLVEVYDLDRVADSKLANISTRGFVQTGDNVMIGGSILVGSAPRKVLIRAIGPELTQHGLPNVLANPTLELHNAAGALIASNDDWQTTIIGGIITSNQVSDIQNSGHAPTAASESAIIANLPVGNYTAIVRGVNNSTGVALVEMYDLP